MMFKKSIKSLIGTRIELEIPFPIQMYLSRVVFNIDIHMYVNITFSECTRQDHGVK